MIGRGVGIVTHQRKPKKENELGTQGQNKKEHEVELESTHFLSARNPTATIDQRELESMAMRVLQMPEVQKSKQQAALRWKTIVGRDGTPEAWGRFDELIEDWAFNYALRAVNSDPNFPKVLGHFFSAPHEWFGLQVPGSNGSGGVGPDQHYSLMPVDGYASYELSGRQVDPSLAYVVMTLTGNNSLSMTLASLEMHDVQLNSNGTFVITLDPEPANGRRNHIQTNIDTRYLFIRDCRSDWRQVPNAYRIRRLDAPAAPPLTIGQIADRAARYMIDDVPTFYWFMRTMAVLDVNAVTAPFNSAGFGLASQWLSFARLKLADDEAYIVTFGSAGASFRDVVLYDFWFRPFDYWNRTSSMTNAQGLPNADGSTTYVISIQDPGVHNWLDPMGYHEPLLIHRWQGLPQEPGSEGEPSAKGTLVKLKELDRHLPGGMKSVTSAERLQQLAERLETFNLRYVDQ